MLLDLREFMLLTLFRSLSSVLPQRILTEDTILTPLQFIVTVVSSRIKIRIATCKNFGPCIIQDFVCCNPVDKPVNLTICNN